MIDNINAINRREKKLIEDELLCIVCLSNIKNVVIKGCNHMDICNECIPKLTTMHHTTCHNLFEETFTVNR